MKAKINLILAAIAVMCVVFFSALDSIFGNENTVDPNGKNLVIQITVLFISGFSCVKLYKNKSLQEFLDRAPDEDVELKK